MTGVSLSGTVLVSIYILQAKADKVGGNWADEGQQQRQHARCEAPLGGSHRNAGATAGDSHVIQSKAQKRKQQCALTRLTHTTESTSLRGRQSKRSI